MFVIEGLLRLCFAVFVFNPVGWLCIAVAFWFNTESSIEYSAALCGAATTAYGMWSLVGSRTVNVIWLVPPAIALLSCSGISVAVLNGIFLTVGANALFQLARRERWFRRSSDLAEPRW